MKEFTPEQWQYIVIGLAVCILLLLFIIIRKNSNTKALYNDLQKRETALTTLQQEQSQLQQDITQTKQNLMQQQTRNEGLQERLQERLNHITELQQQLSKTQQQEDDLTKQLLNIKERLGSAQAWAENQQKQLTQQAQLVIDKEQENRQLNQNILQLEQNLTEIRTTLTQKEQHFIEQSKNFDENKQKLSVEFQNLANRIFEEKSQRFSQSNQTNIDNLLKPFREQIESFQKRVNEVHSESVKGNAQLEGELKKVLDIGLNMSKEAHNLTSALKGNKKVAGNWGEMQLERSLQLAGLIEGEHYSAQESFQDEQHRRRQPDFIVKLPDDKHLIIDSKVSLVDYERAVSSEDETQRNYALQEHIKAIRNHVNELSAKDYSNLIGIHSPNFVLMFVPIEPAYMEAMRLDNTLFNDAYNKNIIIVSHTTLMPILRTVANLWRIERGNKEAREISAKAGELYNQVCVIADRLSKVGGSLNALTNHYNSTITALTGNQGLYGKVERFQKLSSKATKTLPEVEPLYNNIEYPEISVESESTIIKERSNTEN